MPAVIQHFLVCFYVFNFNQDYCGRAVADRSFADGYSSCFNSPSEVFLQYSHMMTEKNSSYVLYILVYVPYVGLVMM